MPKVSVIMPVHNEPELVLKSAINSILNQTFKDFEFIIINDCSENNAEDIILSYKDSRIKYYKNDINLKIIKTLNKGLDLAQGEYIARMDADDISYKYRLEEQVKFLDNNANVGLLNARTYIFPTNQHIMPPIESNDIKYFLRYCANCITHPVIMLRTKVIKENNLKYQEDALHIEDYKLWLDISRYSEIYTLPKELISYRKWEKSVSQTYAMLQYINSRKLIFTEILNDLEINNEDLKNSYFNYLENRYLSPRQYLDLDNVFNKASQKIINNVSQNWAFYIINSLKQHSNELYKSIHW